MQVPRLFAVLFPTATFWRPKWPSRLFAVLFWLPTKLEDKKGVVVHLAAALWRLTNGAGTFGAWKIDA